MTHQYSVEQVQSQLDKIMADVEQGNTVEILRAGRRIAVVVSSQDYDSLTGTKPDFWEAVKAFRRDFNIDEEGVEDDFWEGLRDSSPGREVNL